MHLLITIPSDVNVEQQQKSYITTKNESITSYFNMPLKINRYTWLVTKHITVNNAFKENESHLIIQ
jgi:hypothetical protein